MRMKKLAVIGLYVMMSCSCFGGCGGSEQSDSKNESTTIETDLKIEWTTIETDFKGDTCYVHARGAITPSGFGLITTQPLLLSGTDVFYGIYTSKTNDGGKTWSSITPSETLVRRDIGDEVEIAMCDATPMYHKKTGKILLLGHYAAYRNNALLDPRPRSTTYAVYDEASEDFSSFELLEMPQDEEETYYNSGNGCGQSLELENGDLLIPFYHKNKVSMYYKTSVMRCSFDGEKLKILEIGDPLNVPKGRGLYEPSVVCHNGKYLLAMRNDQSGYVAKGADGLHYEKATELVFDDGQNVGNYNTQQHWLTLGGKLYMVYTRKGANNDHVFRHRAPLFIAEFDVERMCLIRETEEIVVPERGARLGNFGCQSFEDGKSAIVYASEWMQPIGCEKYGSDNSIFVSHISVNTDE